MKCGLPPADIGGICTISEYNRYDDEAPWYQAACVVGGSSGHSFNNFHLPNGTMRGCYAQASNECLCGNWMTFRLTLMLANAIQFTLQVIYYFVYKGNDPQKEMLDAIPSYSWEKWINSCHPFSSVTSLLETFIICMTIFAYRYDPPYSCSTNADKEASESQTQILAFTNLIIEMAKPMFSLAAEEFGKKNYLKVALAFIRVDLLVAYALLYLLQDTYIFVHIWKVFCCPSPTGKVDGHKVIPIAEKEADKLPAAAEVEMAQNAV